MANYKLKTQLGFGKYKGQKVSDVVDTIEGCDYLLWLHNSDKNIKLTDEVLGIINKKKATCMVRNIMEC